MARFGVFLLIMGVGSLLLPLMGRQFILMSLLDPAQPIADRIVTVALLHVVRLEPLEPAAAPGDGAAS